MKDLMREREKDVRNHFNANQLDFDKAISMPRSCLKNAVYIQHSNPEIGRKQANGLLPQASAIILLKIWL